MAWPAVSICSGVMDRAEIAPKAAIHFLSRVSEPSHLAMP
jgi:hypothetical protein